MGDDFVVKFLEDLTRKHEKKKTRKGGDFRVAGLGLKFNTHITLPTLTEGGVDMV